MTARIRLQDAVASYVTRWLSDRPGLNVGYRVLWTVAAACDASLEVLVRGIQASWPGGGDQSALGAIGSSRGIVRGLGDTNDTYAAKLRTWHDQHRARGSSRELCRQIQSYLPHKPVVRVITRWGFWTTIDAAGVITTTDAPWDWDSVSHPERQGAASCSEMFIVIYSDPYLVQGNFGAAGRVFGLNEGVGHKVPVEQSDALRGLIQDWKSGASLVRCVIWSKDPAEFVPGVALSCPDGTWGAWANRPTNPLTVRVPSARFTTCRYWELF